MSHRKYLISTQSYMHEYETGSEIPTQYGYLVETDLNRIVRMLKLKTPTTSPYGERLKTGLRGLAIHGGRVYVASWNSVFLIDYDTFELIDTFSHPLMSDLHGIFVDEKSIWVTSSLIDSVLHFSHNRDLRGVLSFSNTALYPRGLRQEVDIKQDYRYRGKTREGFQSFHANHVTAFDKDYIAVTGRGEGQKNGRVLLVERESLKFRVWLNKLYGPHDGEFLRKDLFAVTETNGSSVALFQLNGWLRPRLRERLPLPQDGSKFWTRGLAKDHNGDLLIGRSVWKGDDRKASLVRMRIDGTVFGVFELDIPDYPECRIFQIVAAIPE